MWRCICDSCESEFRMTESIEREREGERDGGRDGGRKRKKKLEKLKQQQQEEHQLQSKLLLSSNHSFHFHASFVHYHMGGFT